MCVSCFFKQKTAYEMRISDGSSDVCSSDLSVMALATAGMLVSSESKVTVTVAALVSTCVPVTPGTFSSAFSIVMLHAGQVMFAASSTTFSGVFPVAAPANIMSIRPKVHLRMDHLLEKPDHVIRKQQ